MTINRFMEPNIELTINLLDLKNPAHQLALEVFAKNIGKISAPSALFTLLIPKACFGGFQGSLWRGGDTTRNVIWYEGIECIGFNCYWDQMEFFPGRMYALSGTPDKTQDVICIKVDELLRRRTPVKVPIFYEVYATNMTPKKGVVTFEIDFLGRISKTSN